MGARTPDAYRIGAGQVAQEYQADAAPVRLSKQPSLPTMSRAPQAPPVEQVVTAEVAVVRRTAGVSSRQSKEARLSKEPAAVAQCNIVVRDAVPVQAAPVAKSPAPAREYAHLDEAGVAFEGDQRPGVPVHHDWHRTTMRIVNPAGEQVSNKRGVSAPALPVPTQAEEASGVGGASRAQWATRRAGVGASRMDRRERPARRGQHYRGSCSSSASYRRSSLSQPSLVVGFLRGPQLLPASRTPLTPVTRGVYMPAWPAMRPR